jgi:hypothetical protein
MLIALLWLVSTVQLVDEQVEIAANEWGFVDFALKQQSARVRCSFETVPRGAEVQVALVRAAELDELRAGAPLHSAVRAAAGTFEAHTRQTGEYAIVLDNRGRERPVQILLRIDLDFGVPAAATYADPRRQLGAILLSFTIFFGVVTYSARRLLAASRRR